MKTFILILTLFISHLLADEKPLIEDIALYQTQERNISIQNIASYDADFHNLDENTTLDDNSTKWIRLRLRDDLKDGTYIISYAFANFDLATFSEIQAGERFDLHGSHNLTFHYQKDRDAQVYYARLLPMNSFAITYVYMLPKETFYKGLDDYFIYLFIAGVVIGLIMMAAVYNGALYFYNREKSFLYYALMQFFMVGVLMYHTGLPQSISSVIASNPTPYEYLSLFAAFFGVLFARSFLNTKENLPKHDKVLLIFLCIIFLDMLYFKKSFIADYGLYSITTAYFLVVGFLRWRQGFTPAKFYLFGWSVMVIGIAILEYFQEYAFFDTLLIGSATEAIMLAIALAYKIQQLQTQKEQQKALLVHQSKLASMGEMIGNIAHQWRQPLTNLSYILMNVEEIEEKKERKAKIDEATTQISFMSHTIDDFRDFYAPDKKQEYFSLSQETQHVIDLMHFQNIKVDLNIQEDLSILNYKNQYKQVLLNLLANAKEALTQREIQTPQITIMIDKHTIAIQDNAGGIQTEDMQKIFEPYFSSKDEGTGIGLYMSKMIVEKNLGGKLNVSNEKDGAKFTVTLAT